MFTIKLFTIMRRPCAYTANISVVVQFYLWFKFYFPLFWGMAIYDNQFKTMGNKT